MHLWLDLASRAARALQPQLYVADEMADGYIAWVTSRLKVEAPSHAALSRFLTCIEGMHILGAIGRPSVAGYATTEVADLKRRAN